MKRIREQGIASGRERIWEQLMGGLTVLGTWAFPRGRGRHGMLRAFVEALARHTSLHLRWESTAVEHIEDSQPA